MPYDAMGMKKPKKNSMARQIVLGIGMGDDEKKDDEGEGEFGELDEALHSVFDPGTSFEVKKKAFRLAVESITQGQSVEEAEED